MDTGKRTVLNEFQGWKTNLRKVDIYLVASRGPADVPPVNDWQVQLDRKKAVDAGLGCSSINECPDRFDSRRGNSSMRNLESCVKPNIHQDRRSLGNQ